MEVPQASFPASANAADAQFESLPLSEEEARTQPAQIIPAPGRPSPAAEPRRPVPGLPEEYYLVLQANPTPTDLIARLQVLGSSRSASSLGLFVVLFFGLMLIFLAMGEALRVALPDAGALLDIAMALTLIAMLVFPVVFAAMLGISLAQAIRQPKQQSHPDLERQWLLKRGGQTVGRLRLLPEALRLRLLWVSLQANHRGQGIGTAFVRAVLQAEAMPCRVKLSGNSDTAPLRFFQVCGFERSPELNPMNKRRASWRGSPPSLWMSCEPNGVEP